MVRCPVCLAVLDPPDAHRCPMCRQRLGARLGRRAPLLLDEQTRLGTRMLPIDRALVARRHAATFPPDPAHSDPERRDPAHSDSERPEPERPEPERPADPDGPVDADADPPGIDADVQALVDELYRRARAELRAGQLDDVATGLDDA